MLDQTAQVYGRKLPHVSVMVGLLWLGSVATAHANRPPTLSRLDQYRTDTGATFPPNTALPQGVGVFFRGAVMDPDGDKVRLEVELHRLAPATGTATVASGFTTSGTTANTAAATGLAPGKYTWRARAVDRRGAASAWVRQEAYTFKVPLGLPDLVFRAASANPSISFRTFSAGDCEVAEGCAKPGRRKLLSFTSETRNIGGADLVMGDPAGNALFQFSACHRHYHFSGFALYRLVDATGQVAAGRKYGFCMEDGSRFDPAAARSALYNCRYQGIQAGWADTYTANLPCQWIDITGVPPGTYTLELEVNPEHQLPESDYGNNVASIHVQIPGGPTVTPTPTFIGILLPAGIAPKTPTPTATPTPTRIRRE